MAGLEPPRRRGGHDHLPGRAAALQGGAVRRRRAASGIRGRGDHRPLRYHHRRLPPRGDDGPVTVLLQESSTLHGDELLVAAGRARLCADHILGRPVEAFADHRVVPRVIFTDPQVAAVGLTERQARDQAWPSVWRCCSHGGASPAELGRQCVLRADYPRASGLEVQGCWSRSRTTVPAMRS